MGKRGGFFWWVLHTHDNTRWRIISVVSLSLIIFSSHSFPLFIFTTFDASKRAGSCLWTHTRTHTDYKKLRREERREELQDRRRRRKGEITAVEEGRNTRERERKATQDNDSNSKRTNEHHEEPQPNPIFFFTYINTGLLITLPTKKPSLVEGRGKGACIFDPLSLISLVYYVSILPEPTVCEGVCVLATPWKKKKIVYRASKL